MSRSNDLITRYLDDSLTDQEVEELQAWLHEDAANLKQFVAATARDEQLRSVVKSMAPVEPADVSRPVAADEPRTNRRASRIAKWMLAAGLIVAVTWFVQPNENVASVVTFEGGSGSVSLQTLEGQESGLNAGETFTTGILQVKGEGTRANFSYSDGSKVLLAGGAELTFASGSGKQLELSRGTLSANISPQTKRRPLVLRTPTAEAVTHGTSLVIDAHDSDTFLRVNKGTVRLRRLADNQTLVLAQNQEVHAEHAADKQLQAETVKPLPLTWTASPEQKGNLNWKGKWNKGGILQAEPQEIFRKNLDLHETHYLAGVRNDFPGLFTLDKKSAIKIRFRINRPINVGLFLSTHTPTWNFTGNFQGFIEEHKAKPDADGWRTATIPIDSFYPLHQSGQTFQPGCVAATIFATTYADDVGLEVSNLEVVSLEGSGSN